jgi:hypothetical protein
VQPAGTTPLYLSIVRAIEDDVNLASDLMPRRLVVLTDGKNEIWEREPGLRKVEASGVIKAIKGSSQLKGSRIQLHIIGFGEAQQGRDEWRGILQEIKQPDHYYETPVNQSDIEGVIRKTCNLKEFEVASGYEPKRQQKVPGEISLANHRGRQTYEVNIVESKSIQQLPLEGGEAIDLYVVDPENPNPRLRHKRYVRDNGDISAWASQAASEADPQGNKFYVGFHKPIAEAGVVNFPISIQNADESQFSTRPTEAWVEITPLGVAGSGPTRPLVFYDVQFEVGRPVPVLSCRAENWPAWAPRAKIDLFLKPERTAVSRRWRVYDVEGPKPDSRLDVALAEGRKLQFTVAVEQLTGQKAARIVVQEHCSNAADIHKVKVEIEPPPDTKSEIIQREYFHSSGEQQVRHSFVYSGQSAENVRSYWIRITTREDLENDAYRLDSPVEVKVTR